VWVLTLAQHAAAAARLRRPPLARWPRVRALFAALHNDPAAQYSWGLVVLASFVVNCVQAWGPSPRDEVSLSSMRS
jgi:hypothetical protein